MPDHATIAGIQPFAELGRSATVVVYKGYDQAAQQVVLLKVLTPEAAEDPALVDWLEQEGQSVATIQHPNVIALQATGREDGRPYIVTEFVEGWSLAEAIALHGAMPSELAAFIAAEAARGLAAAHEAGVLHRDLKPANVLLGADGRVKLADFGLASRVAANGVVGEVRGTPGYLAPEVVKGESAEAAADLFALGATLAEMLIGRPVFSAATTSDALDAALHHDPIPALRADPRIPSALVDATQRLLDKTPAQRYNTAAEAAEALNAHRQRPGTRALADASILASFLADPDAYRAVRPALPVPPHLADPVQHPAGTVSIDRPSVPPRAQQSTPRRWRLTVVAVVLVVGIVLTAIAIQTGANREATTSTGSDQGDSLVVRLTDPNEPMVDRRPESAEEPVDVLAREAGIEEALGPFAEAIPSTADEQADLGEDAAVPVPEEQEEEPGDRIATELSAAPGRLTVIAQPWAEVFIDGRRVGEGSEVDVEDLAAGVHRVVLRHPEFPEVAEAITVEAGETARLGISLWERVARATLQVHPWAEATLDGQALGAVPPQRTLILKPGSHTLTLTHPSLGTWTTTVQVHAGETPALRYNLAQLLGGDGDS